MKPRNSLAILLLMAALATLSGCTASPGGSSSADNYYEGKTITLIVPNTPGKGMDTYARMIVPYLKKYSKAADVKVENITGAGGTKGVNTLWNSKADGLTIAFTSVPTLILANLAKSEGVQFDATKLTYLARASTEPRVLAVGGKSSIKGIDDIKKLGRPFKFPTQGADEDFFTMAVLADSLNFEMQAITGYEGNADTALAVIKGDGDGHITALSDAEPQIKAGDKRPILMISTDRAKDYPDVPTATEVTTGEGKKSVDAIVQMIALHRSFFGPPNMDPAATTALRKALEQALADPELQKKAADSGLPIAFMAGDEEQKTVQSIADSSKSIEPVLSEALGKIK